MVHFSIHLFFVKIEKNKEKSCLSLRLHRYLAWFPTVVQQFYYATQNEQEGSHKPVSWKLFEIRYVEKRCFPFFFFQSKFYTLDKLLLRLWLRYIFAIRKFSIPFTANTSNRSSLPFPPCIFDIITNRSLIRRIM